jgi:hypothetical protein
MGTETMTKLLPAALLLLATSTASAQPSVTETAPTQGRDSLNLSPLGLIFGDINLNYEHLFDHGHGLIAEVGGGRDSGDLGSDTHGSLAVGYRWHWQHKQNSGFLGVTLAQAVGTGYIEEENGMRYDMRVRSTMLTGNIGKRWMIGDKVNITLRFGLGLGAHTATAKQSTPEAKMAESDMNKILTLLPIGAEGELSIGYVF